MREKLQSLKYYRWLVFGVTMLGTFMATLDSSIVNVALPVIAESLGAEMVTLQWVVTAYLLTISSLLPLFGKAGDMLGRRRVYSAGFTIFTLGSVLCGLSFHIWILVSARILQAVGGAMLMASAPAIVATTFPGKERGRALGMVGTVVALGMLTGPGLGGLLVGIWGWQYIFFINLPIGIAAWSLVQTVLPPDSECKGCKFDLFGAAIFAVGMTSLLLALSNGHDLGWSSPVIILAGIIAVVCFSIFIRYEQRVSQPMIDLSLFQQWQFSSGVMASLLSFTAVFTNVMLLPFYLHDVLRFSPTQIGIVITPFPLVMALIAPLSGYLSERISLSLLTVSGLAVTAAGLLYLATLGANVSMWQVALGTAIIGAGNGLFQSPNNNSVLSSVVQEKLGVASGISALVRNVGMVAGTALAVAVFENQRMKFLVGITEPSANQLIDAFLSGYHLVLVIGASIACVAAVISLKRIQYNKE